MDYHIYLNGEKCGELTEAENARLRKEIKTDPRTWAQYVFAQVWALWKSITLYLRLFGCIGGMVMLVALVLAPQVAESMQGMPILDVANSLRQTGLTLMCVGVCFVMVHFCFSPPVVGFGTVYETAFLRRVRQTKKIQRYGELEVIAFSMSQQKEGQ